MILIVIESDIIKIWYKNDKNNIDIKTCTIINNNLIK